MIAAGRTAVALEQMGPHGVREPCSILKTEAPAEDKGKEAEAQGDKKQADQKGGNGEIQTGDIRFRQHLPTALKNGGNHLQYVIHTSPALFESVGSKPREKVDNELYQFQKKQGRKGHEHEGTKRVQGERHPQKATADKGPKHHRQSPSRNHFQQAEQDSQTESHANKHLNDQRKQVPKLPEEHHDMDASGKSNINCVFQAHTLTPLNVDGLL